MNTPESERYKLTMNDGRVVYVYVYPDKESGAVTMANGISELWHTAKHQERCPIDSEPVVLFEK